MTDKYDDWWFGINMPSDVREALIKANKSIVDDKPTDDLDRLIIRNVDNGGIRIAAARLLDRTFKELGAVEARSPGYFDDIIKRVQEGKER